MTLDLPTPVDPDRLGGSGITVVIPTIPPRRHTMLHRALDSVLQQKLAPEAVIVEMDQWHQGSAPTRNRGLHKVTTPWVAFLDDDDEMLPDHLALLLNHAKATGAHMVYPWFDVPEGFDPFPHAEGRPFRPEQLRDENCIPITVLARTDVLRAVGGFQSKDPSNTESACDDWGTWVKLIALGAKIEHLNRRTWLWHWHGTHTSGLGARW